MVPPQGETFLSVRNLAEPSMTFPGNLNAARVKPAVERQGSVEEQFPLKTRTNNNLTMETVQIWVAFIVISAALSDDVKLKYKPATKPVRLFTDEELRKYDGTEVKLDVTTQSGKCFCTSTCINHVICVSHCVLHFLVQEGQPIYMAVKGVVFDVTKGKGK